VGYVFRLYPRQCGAGIRRNLLSFPKRKLSCRWTWLFRLTFVVCRAVAQPGHRAVLVELFTSGECSSYRPADALVQQVAGL